MKRPKRHLSFGLAIALLALAVFVPQFLRSSFPDLTLGSPDVSEPTDLSRYDDETARKLRIGEMLAPHLERIEREYLERFDEDALLRKAISNLYRLDDFSRFYTKEEYAALRRSSGGYAIGTGLAIAAVRGAYVVTEVVDGSSAKHRGVRVGDRITAIIDGGVLRSAASLTYPALMKIVHPPDAAEGSPVRMVMLGKNGRRRDVLLERTLLPERTVHDASVDADGIAFVRISRFVGERDHGFPSTAGELERALRRLIQDGHVRALVVDLRGNGGGNFTVSILCADLVLARGTIVSTRGRIDGANSRIDAEQEEGFPGDILRGAPIAILADRDSASASEVFIGALVDADPKRAVLVGERTYGKGVAQSFRDLPGGEGVKMTTHKFFSPKGRSPEKKGFDPDIPVETPNPSDGSDPAFDHARAELLRVLATPTSQ